MLIVDSKSNKFDRHKLTQSFSHGLGDHKKEKEIICSHLNIVGFEIFYASEFFSALNEVITRKLLNSVDKVSVEYKNYRNNWFIMLVFEKNNKKIKVQLPPLRKSDYTSPLIASCE